jgi:hypothetical protein
MPKFVIERQYLVPMYQHIAVEAESLDEACKKGISDDVDWDTQEMDCDGARRTTITSVKLVPDGYDVDPKTELIVTCNEEDLWTCSASPRSCTRTQPRRARSSRSRSSSQATNSPPRPLGSS